MADSKVIRVDTVYLESLRARYGSRLSDSELVRLALVDALREPPVAAPAVVYGGAAPLGDPEEFVEEEPEVSEEDLTVLKTYFDTHWKYKTTGRIGAGMFENWLNPPPPYGFSVWHSKSPSMRTWYFRPGLIEKFKKIAKEWEGFSFVVGRAATEPARSAAARLVPFLPGDVEVYFTVKDVGKALGMLVRRTDVPFPLKIDVIRYADDPAYAEVADLYAEHYAAYYWREDHPRDDES